MLFVELEHGPHFEMLRWAVQSKAYLSSISLKGQLHISALSRNYPYDLRSPPRSPDLPPRAGCAAPSARRRLLLEVRLSVPLPYLAGRLLFSVVWTLPRGGNDPTTGHSCHSVDLTSWTTLACREPGINFCAETFLISAAQSPLLPR